MNESRKRLTPLEHRLRSEAAAWAEHVEQQPRLSTPKRLPQKHRRRRLITQCCVLAASLLVIAVGLSLWPPVTLDNTAKNVAVQPIEEKQTDAGGTVAEDLDLAALQATNTAIQKVFGAAAENARIAVDRQLGEVSKLAVQSDSLASLTISSKSGDTIRKWALEPGRRYGAAAQWFDSRLGQLGDSSLSAARRLLNRSPNKESASNKRS